MIPLVLRLRLAGLRHLDLWLPLFLVWLLLLPLVLVLLPFAVLALLIAHVNPWRGLVSLWDVLAGLRGTHVEVAVPGHAVLVHIY